MVPHDGGAPCWAGADDPPEAASRRPLPAAVTAEVSGPSHSTRVVCASLYLGHAQPTS